MHDPGAEPIPRTRVIIPTTDGPIEICRLERMTRLPVSTMQLRGDFRQLRIAPDYHAFVAGPLAANGIADGAFRLELDGEIDTGRSWELPVLVAHLLRDAAPRNRVIWATGQVDADLAPQPGPYQIPRKIERNRAALEAARDAGAEVMAVMPPFADAGEAERVRRALADLGIAAHMPADLPALTRVLEAAPRRGRRLPALPRRLAIGAAVAAAAALGAAAILSALSTGPPDSPAPLAVEGLYSEGERTCSQVNYTQTGGRRIAAAAEGERFVLSGPGDLCEVRLTNRTGRELGLRIDPTLSPLLIYANPMPDILPPGATARLIFASAPASLAARVFADDRVFHLVTD